eukprot:TRINITY_DN120859_c0_g1_i1.p1 TRINITY_DN120859_c0_g1~~TRINITY_DN120859_c0_g1_i1.p1  ORF type:complete len:513 (-),score=33.71 TRINITY_DN120859_c0_g1_i1:80-1519(-)
MLVVLSKSFPLSFTRRFMAGRIVPPKHYNLVSLGGGSGGLSCAMKARRFGKSVCIIDKYKLGGKCVHAGSIPKKIIYNACAIRNDMEYAPHYGVTFNNIKMDWRKLKKLREEYTQKMHLKYKEECKKMGIDIIRGYGSFIGRNQLEIWNEQKKEKTHVTADHIVIATGSMPHIPLNMPGIEECLNSDMIFEIEKLPVSACVIGGGYIGVEIACALHSFGVKTTLAMRGDVILPEFDTETARYLMEYLQKTGITILPHATIPEVTRLSDHSLSVAFYKHKLKEYDAVVCAVGMIPNVEASGFKTIDIALDKRRYIITDEYENTNIAGIYAIGDVTGKTFLASVAKAAGERLAVRLFGKKPESRLDYTIIPSVAFSYPPIGKVGFTESQAENQFGKENVKVYRKLFTQLFHDAAGRNNQPTFVKLVCRKPEETIVGVHAMGRGADEMLQGYAVAMTAGARKVDYENTLAIHPTVSEEFIQL